VVSAAVEERGMKGLIDWNEFAAGQHRVACPSCGRGPRDRTLGVKVDHDGGGVAHCHRCHFVESSRGERSNRHGRLPKSRPATRQQHETLSAWGRDLWRACGPVSGVARDYLEARACVIPPEDGHLRWHPAVAHWPSSYIGPCLIALVTDALTGQALTLHRTWIRRDGMKADCDPPRMLLGKHRKAGGVIRLWPDEELTSGLGIAEGIETALTLAHAHRPTWAAIDAGNLASLAILPGIESLLIAADHDPAGIAAAKTCAQRWLSAGRSVRVVMPDGPGTDLNDVARHAA
jgi:hypothetical protein